MIRSSLTITLVATAAACSGSSDGSEFNDQTDSGLTNMGLTVLGGNTHSVDSVEIDEVATDADDLDVPRDVAFHPDDPGQLWILNRGGPSVTIVDAVGTKDREARLAMGGSQDCGEHFMAEPSALAFGDNGFLATSHEEDMVTPCTGNGPDDFMGPTLWIDDPEVFNADWASHYDMLHNSPNAVGIAWEEANVYWVYDGYHQALTRYDFGDDHGSGGEDHSDGTIRRYIEGEVGYEPNVVSHLVFDPETKFLYVADSANGRVVVLDTKSGVEGGRINPNYDGGDQWEMEDAEFWTLIDGAEHGLERPAGIALVDGLLYVVDNSTGRIAAFDLDGQIVDWLDTGIGGGALMGLTLDENGQIYVADALANRVLRIAPKATVP